MAPQTELIDETGRVVFRGTQSPGGGSSPLRVVRKSIAFDTPGLNLPIVNITNVDQGTKTFEVEAQGLAYIADEFAVGSTIAVDGSTGNDGDYTVVSSTYIPTPGSENVEIIVAEAIPDATADGNVERPGPVGIKLCDLAAGETLIGVVSSSAWLSFLSLVTEWDKGALSVTITAGRGDLPGTAPVGGLGSAFSISTPNNDAFGDFPGVLAYPSAPFDPGDGPIIAQQDTALWAWIDNGGFYPYATQGEGEIVLLILVAP